MEYLEVEFLGTIC